MDPHNLEDNKFEETVNKVLDDLITPEETNEVSVESTLSEITDIVNQEQETKDAETNKPEEVMIRVPTDPNQQLETDAKGRVKMRVNSKIYVEELSQDPPEIDLCDLDRTVKGQKKCCISFVTPPISNMEKRESFMMSEYLKLFLSQYTEVILKRVCKDHKLETEEVLEQYGFMKTIEDTPDNFYDQKWKGTKESHEQRITNNFFSADVNDMLVMYNQFKTDNLAELREELERMYPRECFETAVKIRGSYSTSAKANRRADELMKYDKHTKIYVADVGAWLPICPPDSMIGRQKTIDKQLNKLIWSHRKNIMYANRFFKERINEQVEDKMRKTLHASVAPDPMANNDPDSTTANELMSQLENGNVPRNRRVRKRRSQKGR